jgi:acyl-CoA thioesterase II
MTDWRSDDGKKAMAEVLALLDLEAIEEDIFRGLSPDGRVQRVFGGQVLGQALMAATRTVELSRVCHSLHAYFLRAGDPRVPILYEVDRSRDGHSFTARRVVAIQHGKQIFNLAASYQTPEQGYEHQHPMPDVPPPEQLEDETEARRKHADQLPEGLREWLTRARPFETRPVIQDPPGDRPPRPPYDNVWFRAAGPVPEKFTQALLAYASDATLLSTALLPHGKTLFSNLQVASLDHAMWFHRPFRFDDWMLFAQDSPAASGARGFTRGAIFTRDGTLIASVAQEGLIRPRG